MQLVAGCVPFSTGDPCVPLDINQADTERSDYEEEQNDRHNGDNDKDDGIVGSRRAAIGRDWTRCIQHRLLISCNFNYTKERWVRAQLLYLLSCSQLGKTFKRVQLADEDATEVAQVVAQQHVVLRQIPEVLHQWKRH